MGEGVWVFDELEGYSGGWTVYENRLKDGQFSITTWIQPASRQQRRKYSPLAVNRGINRARGTNPRH